MPDEDPQVSYPIKDLIRDLRAEMATLRADMASNFGRLFDTLAGKADKADLEILRDGQRELSKWKELHEQAHEDAARQHADRRDSRRWITGTVIAILGVAVVVLAAMLTVRP